MKATIKTLALLLIFSVNTSKAQDVNQSTNIPLSLESDEGNTNLVWETQKEVNSSYFLVEGSKDNYTFKTINKVKAAGYSVVKKQYTLEAINELEINLFYRVTLVTMDGERISSIAVNSPTRNVETMLSSK